MGLFCSQLVGDSSLPTIVLTRTLFPLFVPPSWEGAAFQVQRLDKIIHHLVLVQSLHPLIPFFSCGTLPFKILRLSGGAFLHASSHRNCRYCLVGHLVGWTLVSCILQVMKDSRYLLFHGMYDCLFCGCHCLEKKLTILLCLQCSPAGDDRLRSGLVES
jgi:hypothetical protein